MTTAQAIAAADALRPANPYTAEQKTGWLSALDGRLHLGVVCGAPEDAPCYTAGAEETLLAPAPFDGMYPVYLAAQIDFADMDWEAYAASSAMYDSLAGEYARDYIRRNRPASSGAVR